MARALIENTHLIKWSLVLKALSGLLALICGNGYIVGINQIYDIGIDKYVAPLDADQMVTIIFYCSITLKQHVLNISAMILS